MTTPLESWQRPRYTDGGGEPMLFYVVFGKITPATPLSRSKYRSAGVPAGIELLSYGPEKHSDVINSFREGYLWDEFVARSPRLAAVVAKCDHCMILRGTPADSTNLNYLRDSVGLITYLIDQGGCAVYDPLMFQWWSPSEWMERIVEPAGPVPHHHTVILVSKEDESSLKWFHTRGMLKFGRPDISVHHVPPALESGVTDLCNRLIEHMAFGLVVPDGQKIKMASLPCDGIVKHGGHPDDPDFNNVHIEVVLETEKKQSAKLRP
jgi:hypothetical protein